MKQTFFKIRESKLFQYSVLFIIIFNAFTIGLNTYNLGEFSRELIKYLDYLITIFFVIEISIRFIGEPKKLDFFKSGWNVFDTLIVLISLIPIPNNSSFLLLRLLRVFRVLRIISVVPELKKISSNDIFNWDKSPVIGTIYPNPICDFKKTIDDYKNIVKSIKLT